jgi:Xaa-Pro aminopeptidase
MVSELEAMLPSQGKVAMDYSPMSALPRVGRVDAGSVELVRSFGLEVISSGDVSQYATERWSPAQLDSHRYAMSEIIHSMKEAFNFIGENVRWKLTEHDVAEFMRGRFDRAGLFADEGPVVAFNENSSDPHYDPTPEGSAIIRRDGWLLIDAWAKPTSIERFVESDSDEDREPVYADITWVAKIGSSPSPEHLKVFDSVRRARDSAYQFLQRRHRQGESAQGWEADRVARDSIAKDGYGKWFVHRLGHSIGPEVHSNAVNLDDWETHDTRRLIPGICVSIEPGIYLPEFGVRSEMDIFVSETDVEITGEIQDRIHQIEP